MFAPFHLTWPSAGASSPHNIRSKLVFPLPFGPVNWTNVPGDTAKSSSLKSLRSPRTHPSLLSSSIVGHPPAPLYCFATKKHKMRKRRSEEHTSELQSRLHLVCRLLLEKKKKKK